MCKISEYYSICQTVNDIVAKLVRIIWGILDVSDNLWPFVCERLE